MQGILTFAALALGLALTLLFGPEWGIAMGLLSYLAGSNVLLKQDVDKLKAHIDRIINDLPDLLREMLVKIEAPALPPSAPLPQSSPPSKPGSPTSTVEPADSMEQRMEALDQKLELLLRHVQGPTPPAPPPPPSPVTAQPEPPSPAASTIPSAHDLELMRELVLKLAETVAAREAQVASQPPSPLTTQPAAQSVAKNDDAAKRRLSIEELRSELDKLAKELSVELGRSRS